LTAGYAVQEQGPVEVVGGGKAEGWKTMKKKDVIMTVRKKGKQRKKRNRMRTRRETSRSKEGENY
jgi:hypothetical protein